MGASLGEVLPFAVGVAISPIPLVAVILMLFSRREVANSTGFLVGWLLGLTIVSSVVYVIADQLDVGTDGTASDSAATVRMVLGVALLLGGVRRLRRGAAGGAEHAPPKWLSSVESVTPVRAAGLGAVLGAVNPKNLALTLGAATGLAQLGSSTADAVVGLVVFVLVASSTVAAAVIYRAAGGNAARARLDRAKAWLTTHDQAVMAVLFLVFGVVLLANGLASLSD